MDQRFRRCLMILMLGWVFQPGMADARPARVSQVLNGAVYGCQTCHVGAGGPRNAFGAMIEADYLSEPGAAGVVLWGEELAALDADGDGWSNGEELLDPLGEWEIGSPNPGAPALVTAPGVADEVHPAPASSVWGLLILSVLLFAAGWMASEWVLVRTQRRV